MVSGSLEQLGQHASQHQQGYLGACANTTAALVTTSFTLVGSELDRVWETFA
jgi:hypothetical protein